MDYWDSLELLAASLILHQLWLNGTLLSIVSAACVHVLTHMHAHILSAGAQAHNQTNKQIRDPELPPAWLESGLQGLSADLWTEHQLAYTCLISGETDAHSDALNGNSFMT